MVEILTIGVSIKMHTTGWLVQSYDLEIEYQPGEGMRHYDAYQHCLLEINVSTSDVDDGRLR